jgi:hypothetical protein
MTGVRTLAALVSILPLIAAQDAVGAPPTPAPSVSELAVTADAINPSDFSDAEYAALAANRPQTPHYSLEQIASFICQGSGIPTVSTQTAYAATKTFEETKESVRRGKAGMDALVRAEAARQAAVRSMLGGIPVRHLEYLDKITAGNLTIEDVHFRFGNLGGESIIRLHGQFRNSGDRPERVPVITASAVDHFGLLLAQEGYHQLGEGQKIPAGGVFPFDVIFHDGPQYTHEVTVNFGAPVQLRNARTCGVIKPFKAPGQTLDVPRTEDAAQAALDDAGADPLQTEAVTARSFKTGTGRALRVTGSIRNTSARDAMPSRLSIYIKDSAGHSIGEAQSDLKGNVRGGDAAPFDIVVKDFHWLSTTTGQGSFDQMKAISVLVE